jgi:Cys-tRNA(Pro)/Cys-tRNA(Cys) deacylase
MNTDGTPVTRALDALQVPYRLFKHPGPVSSLEQAARERGQAPDQVVRSLVFRLSPAEFVMVLIAGAAQVSWPALRKYLGVSRVTTANADELRRITGYEIGAVSPFGLPRPMRVLADERVFSPQEVSIGSGVRGVTVILSSADLQRALVQVEIVSFANQEDASETDAKP